MRLIIILSMMVGFLFNSVLMRTSGSIPSDDVIFPVMILIAIVPLLAISIGKEIKNDE